VLAACGGGGDPADPFVGTWTYYDSQVRTRCDGQPDDIRELVGQIVLSKVGPEEIAIDTASQYTLAIAVSGTCAPRFEVEGNEAFLIPEGTCFLRDAAGTDLSLDYLRYTLALANVTGPGIEPMTPGLNVDLSARLRANGASCDVDSRATVIEAP
jgi:hypothetical protein